MLVPLAAAAVYVYSHGAIYAIAALLAAWALVIYVRLPTTAVKVASPQI